MPIENLTTARRFPLSIYRPTAGDKKIAAAERTRAYKDGGKRVPGNIDAMNRTAPNSKTREFQVDRKWEIYSRVLMLAGMNPSPPFVF